MSSTYSSNLRVELIGSGDQAGTWGTTTDNNFAYIFDSAIAGINTVTVTSTAQALTYVNGPTSSSALNQSVYAILKFNSASAATAIYAPPAPKTYIIWNNTSYTITIYNSTVIGNTTAAGLGVAILTGNKVMVWSDGTNFYEVQAQNLTGTLAIANGGTGQTTANAAFNALAPAQTNNRLLRSNGTNTSFAQAVLTTDVTGTLPIANGGTGTTSTTFANLTTNVTGTLPIANGGTASTTAATARTNLGLAIGSDVPSPTGTGASGTWGINISGNAATATSATTATSLSTASGAAPSYSARAWVNFEPTNGTIYASGNVSSVTYGFSNYTVNFTTAMPDANYAVTGFDQYQRNCAAPVGSVKSTTQHNMNTFANPSNGFQNDLVVGWFAYFR